MVKVVVVQADTASYGTEYTVSVLKDINVWGEKNHNLKGKHCVAVSL